MSAKASPASVPPAVKFTERAEEIREWLRQTHPEVAEEQRHLDDGTPERAYWHYGYLCALQDVLRLVRHN